MAHFRIEYFDGLEWMERGDGEANVTAEQLIAELPRYAIKYAHRAFLNGKLIGEVPAPKRRGRRVTH